MMSTAMRSHTTNMSSSLAFSDLLIMSETTTTSSTPTVQDSSDYTSFINNDFDDILLQEIVGMLDSSSSSSAAFVEVPILSAPAEESPETTTGLADDTQVIPATPAISTITGDYGVPNPLKGLNYAPATTAVVVSNPKKETIELEASRVIKELAITSSITTTQEIVVVTGVPHTTTAPAVRQVSAEVSVDSTQGCAASVVSEASNEQAAAKSNPQKKRKRSSSSSSITTTTSVPLDEEAKKERNRFHARKSREKKKNMTDELKTCLELLKEENDLLKSQLYQIVGERKCQEAIKRRRLASHDRFIEALKKPQNRIVKRDTLKFLRNLKTKLPSNSNTDTTKEEKEENETESTTIQVLA